MHPDISFHQRTTIYFISKRLCIQDCLVSSLPFLRRLTTAKAPAANAMAIAAAVSAGNALYNKEPQNTRNTGLAAMAHQGLATAAS